MNEGKHSLNISRLVLCKWAAIKFHLNFRFFGFDGFFFPPAHPHTKIQVNPITAENVACVMGLTECHRVDRLIKSHRWDLAIFSWIWHFGSFPADGFIAAGIIRHGGWCARRCSAISNADVSLSLFFPAFKGAGLFWMAAKWFFFFLKKEEHTNV